MFAEIHSQAHGGKIVKSGGFGPYLPKEAELAFTRLELLSRAQQAGWRLVTTTTFEDGSGHGCTVIDTLTLDNEYVIEDSDELVGLRTRITPDVPFNP